MKVSRRNFFKTATSMAVIGPVSGCIRENSPLPTVKFSMNTELYTATTEAEREKIYTTATKYAKYALSDVLNHKISVEINSEPLDITGNSTKELFSQMITHTPNTDAQISHICLCSELPDTPEPTGRAEITYPVKNCYISSKNTNKGVVTCAKPLAKMANKKPKPTLLLRDDSVIQNYLANKAIQTIIHEIGHNLCYTHSMGTAWYGTETPQKYNPVQNTSHIYISPMLGNYYYSNSALQKTETDTHQNLPQFTGTQTLHYCTRFRPPLPNYKT